MKVKCVICKKMVIDTDNKDLKQIFGTTETILNYYLGKERDSKLVCSLKCFNKINRLG